jgi:hypothetical protein
MATAQYDAPQGAHKQDVTVIVGSAISGAVRVTVDSTKSKLEILKALEEIEARIVQAAWPPV